MSASSLREANDGSERLPIIFGVTGHRDLRPENADSLRRAVAGVFQQFRSDYRNTPFFLLSALAEGADRLVATVALEHGFRLIAPLPFQQPEYERDFVRPESLAQFRELLAKANRIFEMPFAEGCSAENIQEPASACRARQYAEVGNFLARHSHILIALWDGIDNGKIGGTAWVKKKREYWQREASDRFQKADPLGYGPFLHIVTPRISGTAIPERACELVSELPVRRTGEDVPYERVYREIDSFNTDVAQRLNSTKAQAALQKAANHLYPAQKCEALAPRLRSMRALFATADSLAGLWQRRTKRSLHELILGTLTAGVAFEVFSHIIHPHYLWRLHPMAFVPLLVFLLMAGFVYRVRQKSARRKEHDRYLNYRALAEALRVQFFWRLAGVPDSIGLHYEGRQWRELDWMRAAVHAQWVLSGAELPFQERGSAGAVKAGIGEATQHWVVDQMEFFRRNAQKEEHHLQRHERLFQGGVILGSTAGLLTLLGHHYHVDRVMPVVLFVTATSFLCAGLIHFRAYKLAFEAHARRYLESLQIFEEAKRRLESADCPPSPATDDGKSSLDHEETCLKIFRHLGREALMENADWVLTHRERPLEVPLG